MTSKTNQKQPARVSSRAITNKGVFEDVAFAKRREKRRKARDAAKAARKKNR